jgi:uncharacterized protein (TIGR02598 family)
MRRSVIFEAAFSLVEVTLALGIAAFCLLAIFGLMPVGVQTNRNTISQTAATSIIAAVVADMRATPKANNTSSQFGIRFGSDTRLYFDGQGQAASSVAPASPTPFQPRYQLNITFPSSPASLSYADFKVTWPAAATLANASGSVEVFAVFNRN